MVSIVQCLEVLLEQKVVNEEEQVDLGLPSVLVQVTLVNGILAKEVPVKEVSLKEVSVMEVSLAREVSSGTEVLVKEFLVPVARELPYVSNLSEVKAVSNCDPQD